jgi:hypothetical protein
MVLRNPSQIYFMSQDGLRLLAALLIGIVGLLPLRNCCGQESDEEETPPPPKTSTINSLPNVLNEGTLDAKARLYLPDEFGSPVLLPSERLADYLEFKRKQKAQSSPQGQLPTYVIEEVRVEANVQGAQAELTAKFDVALSDAEPPVASIPLRFDTCQLTEAPKLTGEGKSLIEVRGAEVGYRWFIHGTPGSKHSAVLRGEAVVTREGERNELKISLPLARSSVVVKLPGKAIDDSVRGQGGEIVERVVKDDVIELQITGSGGELSVSWRESDARSRLSAVEATSSTRMQIDDPRQPWKVSTDVTLRWYGRDANDRVVLELPNGARWLQLPLSVAEQYSISYQSADNSASTDKPPVASISQPKEDQDSIGEQLQQLAPVKLTVRNLDPSRVQPLDLRLEWEWEPPQQLDEASDRPLDMPSLVIQGVDGHTGTVEFVLPASYAPSWKEKAGTQFVQQARLSDVFDRTQYIFRFSRQPIQLTANFRRESNMSIIRPMYLAHIDRNKLKLTAWLDCSFDASQPIAVSMQPGDWLIESAESVEMTAPNAAGEALNVQPQKDGTVLINNTDPTLLEYNEQRRLRQVWRVVAYRTWTADENNGVEFLLPQLQQSSSVYEQADYDHGSGVLIVTCSENLLLKWKENPGAALLVDSLVPQWQPLLSASSAKNPLVYRFQSRGVIPRWSGTAEPLPQQIALQQLATLDVSSSAIRVNQKFTLQIAHEPLTNLRLAVRQDALKFQEPHVMIDGVPVALRPINILNNAIEPASDNVSTSSATVIPAAQSRPTSPVDLQTSQTPESGARDIAGANETAKTDTEERDATSSENSVFPKPELSSTSPSEEGSTAVSTKPEPLAWQLFEPVTIAPLRGAVEISIRTSLPWDSQTSEQLTKVQAPLVQLITPRVTRDQVQSWSLNANRDVEVLENEPETNRPGSIRMMPIGTRPRELEVGQVEIPLNLRKLQSLAISPVRVGRTWLQTVVNGSERRDRYCVQIESINQRVAVRIPTGCELMFVTVDGAKVTDLPGVFTDAGKQFQIDLPDNSRSTHEIEVWMSSSETLTWVTPLKIEIPEIEGAQFFDRRYWQLIVPSIQHLGIASTQLTPEWTWVWGGLYWERESGLSQSDLERWSGAMPQTELSGSVNSYVLSSFGSSRPFKVWVLSRFVLWLPVGLLAILSSVLLLSVRSLRHPAFMLVVAGLLLTAAMLAPDLAVLLGQAAVLSLGIVALMLVTQAAVETRVRRRSVFTVRPTTLSERSDHFSFAKNVKIASQSSTRAQASVIADGGK